MSNKITKFGERYTIPLDQWYETEDGQRHPCDESTIDKLHFVWVTSEGSQRANTDEFAVYVFKEPIEMPTENKYINWNDEQ